MLTVDIEKTPLYKIGVEKGREEGIVEGIFETAIVMIKDFQITIDDVVEKLNIKN